MRKLRVGVAGLGRLGKVHAENVAHRIPRTELRAACSIVPDELDQARAELGVSNVYGDFREMIASAEIDAVCIVTTSSEHCWQVEAALDAGKHVFCEKPLGVDVAQCRAAEAAGARHPDLTCMVGFMRRHDPSYVRAKRIVDEGGIGVPYLVKATGIDPEAVVEGAIRFSPGSGGIFLDMAIHDIDLCRWFLGSEATEVWAMGATFAHPEFREAGDDETGVACYKFANGAMAMVHVGRTAPHGYHVETEIVGTKGTLRISPVPQKDLTMIYGPGGARIECVGSFPERFAEAYRAEMEEFAARALDGRPAGVTLRDGTRATAVAYATTEAWRTGKAVEIPIEP
ncbi:MAG: Gfo/Idh/MocA family oxidoreductase [Synergistaceae bacterium]|nr:Gfo/Idh/MocA family oxidoreductase [Synergistaceae bacterium]